MFDDEATVVIIGLVTNPLVRRGDVATVKPSPALDRAVSRGWVEVTHTVRDGEVTEVLRPDEIPEGTVDEVVEWIGDDVDRASRVLATDESRTTVVRHATKVSGGEDISADASGEEPDTEDQ